MKTLYKCKKDTTTLKIINDERHSRFAIVWEEDSFPMVDIAFLNSQQLSTLMVWLENPLNVNRIFTLSVNSFVEKYELHSIFSYYSPKLERRVSLNNTELKIMKNLVFNENAYLKI